NEWITSWKPASLRAGAMAVKHFGWYWALHSTRKTKSGECFDVYDNTNSQVYKPNSAVAATNKAVNDTWNKRMTRGGKILQAHYCATTTACGAWVDGDWMSQHGSEDQAKRGWNYQRILKHWYSNMTLSNVKRGSACPHRCPGAGSSPDWQGSPRPPRPWRPSPRRALPRCPRSTWRSWCWPPSSTRSRTTPTSRRARPRACGWSSRHFRRKACSTPSTSTATPAP